MPVPYCVLVDLRIDGLQDWRLGRLELQPMQIADPLQMFLDLLDLLQLGR